MKILLGSILFFFLISCSGGKEDFTLTFRNCQDIQNYVTKSIKDSSSGSPQNATQVSAGAADNSHLNLQENGVDESDFLRIQSKLLFVAHRGGIEVLKRSPLTKLGVLEMDSRDTLRLFSTPTRLVVLASDFVRTTVTIFKLEGEAYPQMMSSKILMGNYIDSRLVENRLVVVQNDSNTLNYTNEGLAKLNLDKEGKLSGVVCSCVEAPEKYGSGFQLTKVNSINTDNPETEPQAIGFFGNAQTIYMSLKNLYVAGNRWERNAKTKIVKVDVGEKLHIQARGKIDGYVKDRWAFKELSENGYLSIISTLFINELGQANQLHVLEQVDGELKTIAGSEVFGRGEDIRAVRYQGNMAYAVTFEKTDPLFAIDLTDPRKPNLKGELQVPGFSAYLHPITGNQMIGVGFDAKDMGNFSWFQGIQVSLFNVANPLNITLLDNKILGVRGSFSDPTSDAHAFYYDSSRKRIGLPIVELAGTPQNPWEFGNELKFSGAIIYKVENSLQEEKRLTHSSFIPQACKTLMSRGQWWQSSDASYDINRMVNLDSRLLTISRFGIVPLNEDSLNEVDTSVLFSKDAEERFCERGPEILPSWD